MGQRLRAGLAFVRHMPVTRRADRHPIATEASAEAPAMPVPRHGLPSISCVLPCRNEARNLELLLPRLANVLSRIGEHFEVIIVDDGSADEPGRRS